MKLNFIYKEKNGNRHLVISPDGCGVGYINRRSTMSLSSIIRKNNGRRSTDK